MPEKSENRKAELTKMKGEMGTAKGKVSSESVQSISS